MTLRFTALLLILYTPLVLADFCPPASQASGGMSDLMLLYVGQRRWPLEHFRPYVAYLDKRTGKARDWFFDGWLFLMYGGAPSKHKYISGATDKRDWLYFLDLLWQPGLNLSALDDCIAQVGEELGDRDKVYPVIIMIPYPSVEQREFGDIDGDGLSEDLSKPTERLKVVQWFVDETLRRWSSSSFSHTKLWGFYWMNEHIPAQDEEIVRQTSSFVHKKGYKMHWIPWYLAAGHEKWRELGLDFVVMQPNFAFLQPWRGTRLPNEDRLTGNANRARALGMGVEMELNGREVQRWESRWNLAQYLNHGLDELDGYMRGSARAWYQGYNSLRALYESDNPQCNQLYDDIYRFHKGTYRRRQVSQADGHPCKVITESNVIPARDSGKLTDGLWVTRGERLDRALVLKARRASIHVDLGTIELVESVGVHLVGGDFPSAVRVLTANSEGKVSLAGQSAELPAIKAGDYTVGFVSVSFPARLARYVEIELTAVKPIEMRVDEIVIPPAGHLLLGASYECSGQVTRADAIALTDGLYGGRWVSWRRKGEVTFHLGRTRFARMLRAHILRNSMPLTVHAVVDGKGVQFKGSLSSHGGWVEVGLGAMAVRELKLSFDAQGLFACDEVQLLSAVSLAIGKPYAVEPTFAPTYPDDGGELTDGVLTKSGFGDGKTVGWISVSPQVTLDLGRRIKIDTVRVHAEGGGYAWVNFPYVVVVTTSFDGKVWTRVAGKRLKPEITYRSKVADERLELGWITLRFPSCEARLVRVSFKTIGWTMLSEIEVLSAGKNVARGTTYSLRPLPSSKMKYADNNAILTDGLYSLGGGWRGCAGWAKADPMITVDLQALRNIGTISVHLVGGGAGAVFFPRRVDFSVSKDGESWQNLGSVTEHPKEDGTSVIAGCMNIQLSKPVFARYIRLRLKHRGWVMPDEVEVYPP